MNVKSGDVYVHIHVQCINKCTRGVLHICTCCTCTCTLSIIVLGAFELNNTSSSLCDCFFE